MPPCLALKKNVEDVLTEAGGFGRFQLVALTVLSFACAPEVMQGLIMYFAADIPSWMCVRNNSMCTAGQSFSADDRSRCVMNVSDFQYTASDGYSFVLDFDLGCEQDWIVQLPTFAFFIAYAVASTAIGGLSDRLGRKKIIQFSFPGLIIFSTLCSVSPNFVFLVIVRAVAGLCGPGCLMVICTYMSECVQSKHRAKVNATLFLSWPLGLCVLSGTAYFIREWRILIAVTSSPFLIIAGAIVFLPESVQWLHYNKPSEAWSTLQKIALWNRSEIPHDIRLDGNSRSDRSKKSTSICKIFQPISMATLSVIQAILYFADNLVYFGIAMAADDITFGSIYLNFLLACVVDIPAYLMLPFTLDKAGRKRTTVVPLFLSGIACIGVVFISKTGSWQWVRLAVAVVGRFFAALTFGAMIPWSLEIYPTSVRSVGAGFVYFAGMVGASAAPWIAKSLKSVHSTAPFASMGGLAVITSFLVLHLPETKDRQLRLDTEMDAGNAPVVENFHKISDKL